LKILLVHNRYQSKGGEDTVFDAEYKMLINNGDDVQTLIFDNKKIVSFADKIYTSLNSFYNRNSARKMEDAILSFHPDIIHVHNFFYIASPSIFFVAHKYAVPVVMTLHNYRLICANGLLFRNVQVCTLCTKKVVPFDGILYKCFQNSNIGTASVSLMTSFHKIIGTWKHKVDRYIALSEFARKIFLESSLQLAPEQIITKVNFVEDPGPEILEREDYYLFVGRLSEEKRIQTVLKAQSKYKFKIKIIGDGPFRYIVENAASENENIEFLGIQSREFIIDMMKRSRALLFTSLWYEGMPMTILEAFSTGTPVISSDKGILSTLIRDNVNGFLFESGNSEGLAEKIEFFDTHIDELKDFYKNARQTYLDNYTPELNYKLLIGIYEDVIKQKKSQLKLP